MAVISCDLLPQAVRDVLGQLGLGQWGNLVFDAYGAPLDVVNYICINAGPVNWFSGLGLYLFHPKVCAVEVSEGTVKKLRGTQIWSPFRRIPALMDSSS